MLYTSPSKSSSSHQSNLLPVVACAPKTGRSPENQVLEPIPTPGRILTRLAVSSSPLRRKVLEFKSVLKDRMTPRELIAFVGASASVRRNEKRAQLCHRHKGGHHARQSPGRKNV
jgi:hypothetical protein